jgi:hypothetical protein
MSLDVLQKELDEKRSFGKLEQSFFDELSHYKKIILRGAGRFGTEICQHLINKGVDKEKLLFWDVRAEDICSVHDVDVHLPFTDESDKDGVIIIHCIPNGSLSGSTIRRELIQHGYANLLDGMALFEASVCKMDNDTGYDSKVCLDTTVCNWDACERLMHFTKRDRCNPKYKAEEATFSFQVIAFVLSLKCTLSCTHCAQYINTYDEQDKAHHLPLEDLKNDIDRFFGAVDTVGFESVIGGESLLHPDFDKIIEHILTKQNFGVLGVTTNGVVKLSDKHLKILKNDRTRLIFSDYTKVLSEKQKQLFQTNIEKAREFGVNITVGEPVWIEPPSLKAMGFNVEQMTEMKAGCNSFRTCKTVQQGKLYPCGVSPTVHQLEAGDYATDYVDLYGPDLRTAIKELHARPYYSSCNHCGDGGKHLSHSGEQNGYHSRYDHLLEKIEIVSA